jgi:hypothetical protein
VQLNLKADSKVNQLLHVNTGNFRGDKEQCRSVSDAVGVERSILKNVILASRSDTEPMTAIRFLLIRLDSAAFTVPQSTSSLWHIAFSGHRFALVDIGLTENPPEPAHKYCSFGILC